MSFELHKCEERYWWEVWGYLHDHLTQVIILFQALSIEINDKQFNQMGQISITVYLAKEKNENKTLNLHTGKEQGRTCITLLKKRIYFWLILKLPCKARWKEAEEHFSGYIPIQAWLSDKRLIQKLMDLGNKWINLSVKTWQNIIIKVSLIEEIKKVLTRYWFCT